MNQVNNNKEVGFFEVKLHVCMYDGVRTEAPDHPTCRYGHSPTR